MAEQKERIDVLVIGADASGAAFTWSLSQARINVVCLEQGERKTLLHDAR
jgi:choline dehydrogenase-like flavoprotein